MKYTYLGVKVFPGRILEGFLPPTPPLMLLFPSPVKVGISASQAFVLRSVDKLRGLSDAETKLSGRAVLLFPVTVAESKSGSRAVPLPEYEPTGTGKPGPATACEISVLLSKMRFSFCMGSSSVPAALELGIAEEVPVPLASLETCMTGVLLVVIKRSETDAEGTTLFPPGTSGCKPEPVTACGILLLLSKLEFSPSKGSLIWSLGVPAILELGIAEEVSVPLASLEACMTILLPVVIEKSETDTEGTALFRDTEDKVSLTYRHLRCSK